MQEGYTNSEIKVEVSNVAIHSWQPNALGGSTNDNPLMSRLADLRWLHAYLNTVLSLFYVHYLLFLRGSSHASLYKNFLRTASDLPLYNLRALRKLSIKLSQWTPCAAPYPYLYDLKALPTPQVQLQNSSHHSALSLYNLRVLQTPTTSDLFASLGIYICTASKLFDSRRPTISEHSEWLWTLCITPHPPLCTLRAIQTTTTPEPIETLHITYVNPLIYTRFNSR